MCPLYPLCPTSQSLTQKTSVNASVPSVPFVVPALEHLTMDSRNSANKNAEEKKD